MNAEMLRFRRIAVAHRDPQQVRQQRNGFVLCEMIGSWGSTLQS
jgi:hypothetical protein